MTRTATLYVGVASPLVEVSYDEALKVYRRLAKQHPAAFEPDVAMTLNNLGTVQSALGEREAARASYEEALEIRRRLATQHPAAFEPVVATTLNNLGNLQRELGEPLTLPNTTTCFAETPTAFTRFSGVVARPAVLRLVAIRPWDSTMWRSTGLGGRSGVGVGPIGRCTADFSSSLASRLARN